MTGLFSGWEVTAAVCENFARLSTPASMALDVHNMKRQESQKYIPIQPATSVKTLPPTSYVFSRS